MYQKIIYTYKRFNVCTYIVQKSINLCKYIIEKNVLYNMYTIYYLKLLLKNNRSING